MGGVAVAAFDLDQEGKMPLSNKEYASFLMLVGFADTLDQESGKLEKRAKLAGKNAWRDLKMLTTVSHNVAQALFDTIPAKKQLLVAEELKRAVAGVVIKPPANLPVHQPTNYTTIPTQSLEWLIDQILQWECLCCIKEGKDQKKCPFREKLETMYAFELPDVKKGECPFQTMERFSRKELEDKA